MSFRSLSCAAAAENTNNFSVPIYRKTILLPALALFAAFAFLHFGAPASAQTATEQACFDAVQNKVAWSQGGPTAWDPTNVNNLCRGAVDYQARVACFTAGIANHNDWGRAIGECQATGGADATTSAPAAASSAASNGFVPVTNSAVRIESSQDRSRAVNVLDSENPVASNFPADQPSTQWIIVPAQEAPFYRLSSVVRPNLFLNNEGGILTTSVPQDGWYSAQWTFESGDGANWRVCNRWTGECLRLLNGKLALAAAAPGEPDALWVLPGASGAAPQAGGTLTPVAAPDPEPAPETVVLSAETPAEQACFDAVQGKVAWSQAGGTTWDPANIKSLCKGAVDPQARIACFSSRIQKLDDWAKAIEGCRASGTTAATSGTSSSTNLSAAKSGSKNEQACFNAIQGKVAWNRAGATLWGRSTVEDFCKGVVNYEARIGCFQNGITAHGDTQKAIDECKNLVVEWPEKTGEATVELANAGTFAFANAWNTAIQLTAERDASVPTADVASPGWVSADWVLEPAPASFGPRVYYIRNKWRDTYLTYLDEYDPSEGSSNIQLLPRKRSDTNDRDETLLAQGQIWNIEPVDDSGNKLVRIRTAHTGFGLTYLTIVAQGEGTHNGGLPFLSFRQPYGGVRVGDLPGSKWFMFVSSHADQQQCVRNLSLTAFDAEWYKARDAVYSILNDNSLIIRPGSSSKPVLTETKALGTTSCENENERMIAVIKPVGVGQANQFVALATVAAGGLIGFFGTNEVGVVLDKKSLSTVYMGVPGKISIGGTLYDAKTAIDEPLKR